MEKTIEDMHKTFLEFHDRALASGIQKGAPALAGHLRSTADRLSELAKSSTEESDVEDENEAGRCVQSVAAEPRSRRGRRVGPETVPMLGYQTTFGEDEDEEEGDAGEIAAPPARFALDNDLPLLDRSDWTRTENMQQLRNEGPISNTRNLNNIQPVQQKWADVLDNDIERFLRSKGLYRDGQFSEAFGPIDPSLGAEETRLSTVYSPYCSPSLNSSGGPHTPESTDTYLPNEPSSSGSHFFWHETRKVPNASDRDMTSSFDDPIICL